MAQKYIETVGGFKKIIVILCLLLASNVMAAEEFYKGKTVKWTVAAGIGSITGSLTRIISKTFKAMTGTKVIVQNRGSLVGTNWSYSKGTRDGLNILSKATSVMLSSGLIGGTGIKYDAIKFQYLADISPDMIALFVANRAKYKTLSDLKESPRLHAGASSVKGGMAINAAIFIEMLGLKSKIVVGYSGSHGAYKALLAGEIDFIIVRSSVFSSHVQSGMLRALCTIADQRSSSLPDVPSFTDLGIKVSNELKPLYDLMSMGGTSVALPPGVPVDRVLYLRKVLYSIGNTAEVQGKIRKLTGVFNPFISGAKVQNNMTRMLSNRGFGDKMNSVLAKYTLYKP